MRKSSKKQRKNSEIDKWKNIKFHKKKLIKKEEKFRGNLSEGKKKNFVINQKIINWYNSVEEIKVWK